MLITTTQLAAHLTDPDWVVCDCRHSLAAPDEGRQAYLAAHIPGARFLHLDEDLSGPKTGRNGRHPLPDPNRLAARLGALGIDTSKQVVAYDAAGGAFAARLWWLLRWLGHQRAALLDGGFPQWLAHQCPTSNALPVPQPVTFTVAPDDSLRVELGQVAAHFGDGTLRLIDARSPDRYAGQNETLDPVAGHIPGASNRFFRLNLDPSDCFLEPAALRREFEALLTGARPQQVVHQCGSGVTACHNLFAMELAGLPGSKLYPGSWSEWCVDPARPVATA